MKIGLTVHVENDDGSPFLDGTLTYYGIKREVFPVMEKDILDIFLKWNAWDAEVQAQKARAK